MTPKEYIQLKAFARIDGAILGAVWAVSFFLCLAGFTNPGMSLAGSLLAVASPFIAGTRLKKFRDGARDGIISFRRAVAYYIMIFFYASLIFAVVQYIYFAYFDNGYVMNYYVNTLNMPETQQMLTAAGLSSKEMEAALAQMQQTSPILMALNVLTFNITTGMIISPIAGVLIKKNTSNN